MFAVLLAHCHATKQLGYAICHSPAIQAHQNIVPYFTMGHTNSIYALTIVTSTQGTLLASGSWDNTIKLWQPDTGECVMTLYSLHDRQGTVQFALDELQKRFASVSTGGWRYAYYREANGLTIYPAESVQAGLIITD